jgi:hypothetical protein
VDERLREAEDGLGLACRLDRRNERLPAATRRRPVRCELGRGRVDTRKLLRETRVHLLAFTGKQCRVGRLRKQRVAEAETARRLVCDEDAFLDGTAQRVAHVELRVHCRGAEQRVVDVAPSSRCEAQQFLCATVEPPDPQQQQVAETVREPAGVIIGGGE